jgi:transposase
MDLAKCHLHWGKSSHKGKVYKSYSLAMAVRENGKNRKVIVKSLGKLADKEVETWKRNLQFAKKGEDSDLAPLAQVEVEYSQSYLDVAVALETWNSWGLSQVFNRKGNHEVSLNSVAAALTINRCIDPLSKVKVSDWFGNTALPHLMGVDPEKMNSSRIFRELSSIETVKDQICEHIYQAIFKNNPESLNSVFYDLSSTTFTGTKCILMKWGHCKEGYENHIVLALVVNSQGFPIYWNVLTGGTNDATTIDWLVKELGDKFNFKEVTLVFDRGMVSEDNLALLEGKNIKYISAMDKNQIPGFAGVDFNSYTAASTEEALQKLLDSKQFIKHSDNAYYREVEPKGGRRYLLCFNPQLHTDQQKARQEAVDSFEYFVKRTNRELREAEKSRSDKSTLKKFTDELTRLKLKGFVKVHLKEKKIRREVDTKTKTICTYECQYEVDESKKILAGSLDGFWMAVTNHVDTSIKPAAEIINPYREKVEVEWSFRDIKSFIEISPVRVWSMEHVKAHYTICVLAHLLNRTLSKALHDNKGESSKKVISHEELFRKLEPCRLNKMSTKDRSKSRWSLTSTTDIQRDLLARMGYTRLLKEDFANLKCTLAR